jgi:predicted transcriptional regulator
MNAVWELGGNCSVRDVIEHSYPNGEKAYTTIQAFMNILERKKVLQRKKIGMVNFYTPTHPKSEIIEAEMSSLLYKVFDGSIAALANSLMSLENVDLKELEKIKALLSKKEKELQGDKNE